MAGFARDEGGFSGRQLKNAAAEPPNRYDARHVPSTATNSRARAAAGPARGLQGAAALHQPTVHEEQSRGVDVRRALSHSHEFLRKPVRCIVTC